MPPPAPAARQAADQHLAGHARQRQQFERRLVDRRLRQFLQQRDIGKIRRPHVVELCQPIELPFGDPLRPAFRDHLGRAVDAVELAAFHGEVHGRCGRKSRDQLETGAEQLVHDDRNVVLRGARPGRTEYRFFLPRVLDGGNAGTLQNADQARFAAPERPERGKAPRVEFQIVVRLQDLRDRDVVVHQAEHGAVLGRGVVEMVHLPQAAAPGMKIGIAFGRPGMWRGRCIAISASGWSKDRPPRMRW